jgi:cell division protease FtsH
MEKGTRTIIILYFVAAFLLPIGVIHLLQAPPAENIAYNQFKQLVKQRMVADLVVSAKDIRGEINTAGIKSLFPPEQLKQMGYDGRSNLPFKTLRVEDPNLASELEEAGIRFSAEALDPWVSMILSWVIPVLLIFVLWGYVFKRMGSASGEHRKGLH